MNLFFPCTNVPRTPTVGWVRTGLPPIASISSKKIRQAFLVLAISKSSRTILAPCTQMGCLTTCFYFFNSSFQSPVFFPETHLSDVLLHQLGADHPDEACVGSVGHGTSTEGLPCARWSKQQHALRGLNAQIDKPLGLEDRRTEDNIADLWSNSCYLFFGSSWSDPDFFFSSSRVRCGHFYIWQCFCCWCFMVLQLECNWKWRLLPHFALHSSPLQNVAIAFHSFIQTWSRSKRLVEFSWTLTCSRGVSTTSLSFSICSLHPPTSL